MVQKEVKKKTQAYGLMAILLASVCVAMIYSFGTGPGIAPLPGPNPSTGANSMQTFDSYSELKNFLTENANNGDNRYYATFSGNSMPMPVPTAMPQLAPSQAEITSGVTDKGFSTTNIQVSGVDEADSVKTDGSYIYVLSNNTVYILDADPQNAKVIAKIAYKDSSLSGIYLSQDGKKLAVLGNAYVYENYTYTYNDTAYYRETYPIDKPAPSPSSTTYSYTYQIITRTDTFVYVYDLTSKTSPALARNFTMSGGYANSRMINNYVYLIISESASIDNNMVNLPTVYKNSMGTTVDPSGIFYADGSSDSYYEYTTFVALNMANDAQTPTNMTILMGGTGTIYVSPTNIYVTYPTWTYEEEPMPTNNPTYAPMPSDKDLFGTGILPVYPFKTIVTWQGTAIYRVQISGDSMTFAAKGNVTGNVLNQYSMDEYNGYFRIVTSAWIDYTQQNNVYTLDMNLNIVGKLENLASGENFHSARFMGDRCYLVTFLTTDPLFVIDLSQPANPRVLGELIIPGYSDYLHPYDANHLIGLGKDAVVDNQSSFAWYQGLKLSLFDVTNVTAPTEIAKYSIGDRGTSSEALYEPKAFLFDASKNLLVLPVDLYIVNETAASSPTAQEGKYGQFVWQGVYVFDVTLTNGFVLRGNVTQMDNADAIMANPYLLMDISYQWMDYWHFINRALYIEDTLYTFSANRVQLNSLDDFALIAKIDLN
jgi:uncharacterized secreted protein with C-terminal beta-propeller domain